MQKYYAFADSVDVTPDRFQHYVEVYLADQVAALEADAARYRWLRETDPTSVCCIAWRNQKACKYNNVDEAVDAARSLMVRSS